MKKLSLFLVALALACGEDHAHKHGPGGHDHGEGGHVHDDGHGHKRDRGHGHDHGTEDGRPTVAKTTWTEKSELFVEFPALTVGRPSRFIAHLTALADFSPLTKGRVTVVMEGAESAAATAASALRPGIFAPTLTPTAAGRAKLLLQVEGPGFSDAHDLGFVTVHTEAPKAEAKAENPNEISFLKERQWQIDFAVVPVLKRKLTERVSAPGTVQAPLTGASALYSPAAGRLQGGDGGFPLVGASVRKGQTVARISSAALPQPAPVVSPVDGIVTAAQAGPGDTVEAGWKLFDVADTARVWIEARVYESDLPKVRGATAALISPRDGSTVPTRRLVSRGGSVDADSRTAPMVFEAVNPSGRLKVGAAVDVLIAVGGGREGLAAPRSAVLDEDGAFVVYVQTGGESFERRVVTLGGRDGADVEIRTGVAAGERVVSKGAYRVRLAAAKTEVGHGHAH